MNRITVKTSFSRECRGSATPRRRFWWRREMQNARSGAGRSPLAALWVSVARSAGRVVWRSYTGANSGILFAALLITVAIFGVLLRDEGFFTVDNLLNI